MKFLALVLLVMISTEIKGNGKMKAINMESNVSNKLDTSENSSFALGKPVFATCALENQNSVKFCSWTLPNNDVIIVDETGVKYKNGDSASEFDGIKSDKICGVTLHSLTYELVGSWMCHIEMENVEQFQESFIHVSNERVSDVRLPTTLRPITYELKVIPFIIPENFTIDGYEKIDVSVTSPTSSIVMHINDIIIVENSVKVFAKENGNIVDKKIIGHAYDEAREFYIIRLEENLPIGNVSIFLNFIGDLNDGLDGFYRSTYTDSDGETKYIAVTDFEPTQARKAFPCFDEPLMKARFTIHIGRTKNMSSISNMPIKTKGSPMKDAEDYVWDIYTQSRRMSTYLVAMIVSDFDYVVSSPLENNVIFRIWSRKSVIDQTSYAKEVGPRILAYYEDYFGIDFPLPKQDMIAIPDFNAGAMENWGLITYREVALLYSKNVSSQSDREYVAKVCAHELSHQWFGDLVTMEWWNDLWLNEGFARYMETIGVPHVEPDTFFSDRFVVDQLQDIFNLDSLSTTHEISKPVSHPDEIAEIFDGISYSKGASIIRMMANFLTMPNFNKGLHNYLYNYRYENANQDDLWHFLTESALGSNLLPTNVSVKEIMDTWTLQPGYPVVTVSRKYPSRSAIIEQSRFIVGEDTNGHKNLRWWIPITFTQFDDQNGLKNPTRWMSNDGAAIEIKNLQEAPILLNIEQTGYYRVNYDAQNWNLLTQELLKDHKKILWTNRAQLIDDSFNLAANSLLDYQIALDLTMYLNEENEYVPWKAAINNFNYLILMMRRSPQYDILRNYLNSISSKHFSDSRALLPKNETFIQEMFRNLITSFSCDLEHKPCLEDSVSLFKQWRNSPDSNKENPIDVEIRSSVYCTAIAQGDAADWEFLWQRYQDSSVSSEKDTILNALGCSSDLTTLKTYLAMSIDESSGVRKQDASYVATSVAKNVIGRYIAWDWIRGEWEAINEVFEGSSFIGKVVMAIAGDFNTEINLKELQAFKDEHENDFGSSESSINNAIEITKKNVYWKKFHHESVIDWLNHFNRLENN